MLGYFLIIKGTIKRTLEFSHRAKETSGWCYKTFRPTSFSSQIHYRCSTDQSIPSEPYVEKNVTTSVHQKEATETAQWVKTLVGKPHNLESDPWKTHMVGENQPHKLSSDLHICAMACVHVHTFMHMWTHTYNWLNKYNKTFKVLAVSLTQLIGSYYWVFWCPS